MSVQAAGHWRRYRLLYALLAVCSAPIIAAYLAYYVYQPSGRTNYGALIAPRPLAEARLRTTDGNPFDFRSLAGKWVLVTIGGGDCAARCSDALLQMRQQRLMTGKDRERIERVWLITDGAPVSAQRMREYEGTLWVRAPADAVREWTSEPRLADLEGVVWLIDPMGNLMLRWPQDPDQQRVKSDLARLLTASSHWVRVEKSR